MLLGQACRITAAALLPALGACDSTLQPPPPQPDPVPSPPPSAPTGPVVTADVTFEKSAQAATVDSHFSGLSYEKNKLAVPLFTGGNAALIRLFRTLGPSVLRIGANQVDRSSWNGVGDRLTPILPEHVDALAAFIEAAGWEVIYGVNMARNTATRAAEEAAYVFERLGPSLRAWEIGNEPDLYRRHGYRPDSWNYDDYLSEWRKLRDAMTKVSPGVPFSGPATAFAIERMTLPFAEDEGERLALLTQHYYRADGQDPNSTLDLLLEPHADLQRELDVLVDAAADAGIAQGFRYAEANNFYNGGRPNVSNAFGTALWAIDFMFTCALNGCTGVNFHSGGSGPGYTPIADDGGVVIEARPEFYGLLMFARAGPGVPVKGKATTPETIKLSAWGVERPDGGFNALLLNKDDTRNISMNVSTGGSATSFDPLWLRGRYLAAATGQTLGGGAIGSDGTWTPEAQPAISTSGGSLPVLLPPASAVLLRSL